MADMTQGAAIEAVAHERCTVCRDGLAVVMWDEPADGGNRTRWQRDCGYCGWYEAFLDGPGDEVPLVDWSGWTVEMGESK